MATPMMPWGIRIAPVRILSTIGSADQHDMLVAYGVQLVESRSTAIKCFSPIVQRHFSLLQHLVPSGLTLPTTIV